MGIAGLGLAAADSALLVFLLFALLGLGHLMITVAVQGLVARGSGEHSYDARFAALTFTGSIGQLFGPAIGGFVAGSGSPEETTRTPPGRRGPPGVSHGPRGRPWPPSCGRPGSSARSWSPRP
jgi:MFS family permease